MVRDCHARRWVDAFRIDDVWPGVGLPHWIGRLWREVSLTCARILQRFLVGKTAVCIAVANEYAHIFSYKRRLFFVSRS